MDLKKLVGSVEEIAIEAGKFIIGESQKFDRERIEYKGLNDLVSYVDKEAEKKIVGSLSSLLPSAGFIAEEGTGEKKENGLNWVIDPLDGTTNFIHGVPVFSVSIGLVEGNDVLLGVIYEPNRDECFSAVKGNGAYCNEEKIEVSKAKALKDALLVTGFPYHSIGKLPQFLDALSEVVHKTHGFRRLGSAAVDLCYVACGRFEGFFEFGLNPWDVAAGVLIVQEAGGKVTDFDNGNNFIFGKELLASTPNVHGEVMEILQKHFKG